MRVVPCRVLVDALPCFTQPVHALHVACGQVRRLLLVGGGKGCHGLRVLYLPVGDLGRLRRLAVMQCVVLVLCDTQRLTRLSAHAFRFHQPIVLMRINAPPDQNASK